MNINEKDTSIASFLIVTKFLGINISEDQIKHEITLVKADEVALMNMAKRFHLKSTLVKCSYDKIREVETPIIAKGNNGDFFIIVRSNRDMQNEKIMIMDPLKGKPELVTVDELSNIWDGTAVIITTRGIVDKEAVFGFKWFIPTIMKFKTQFIEVLLAVFVIQIIGLLTPVMTQVVVDKVLVHNSKSTLMVLAMGIGLSYIFELVLGLAKNYVFSHTTNRIDVILSSRLFKHLFALPLRYFESRRTGDTVARVRELDTIRNFLTGTPLSALIDLVFIFVYIIVLFFYSVKLSWIVIASIPVFALVSIVVTPLFKKRLDEKFNAGAEVQSYLVETISGVQTIKSYALEPKLEKRWGELQADYVKAGYRTAMVASAANMLSQFIQKMFDLVILVAGACAVMKGDFSIGQLVAFRMLAGRVSGPVLRFVQLWQEYQQASLSVKRIGDIFNSAPEPKPSSNISLPAIKGNIKFEDVVFRYQLDTPEVIRKMSFEIEEGKIIGVVGRSGSGKSTISKLVQRLYIAESGKILIDGIDISLVNPSWLRTQMGVVLQENFMFNGTIAENISIHCKNASMDRIISAAKTAGADEFIMKMQNGYDTIIGERGVGLSGGQKQRIAIARAILNNPRILILDEATSALDYESESIIQNNLKDICKGRTVIIIAHRLSTLKDADKIMVIDNGELAEYDTPINLLKRKGLFWNLHNKQARGDADA